MQPYVNPYLFQQPMYQPQMYQPQNVTQVQLSTLNGRLVDNIDSVSANDVPMQGISVFPKNDLSEVYVKSWNPNGTIQTIRFLPYKACENLQTNKVSTDTLDVSKQATDEVYDGIMQRLADIESKIDKIVTPVKGRKADNES